MKINFTDDYLAALVEKYGTPLYVYDREKLRQQISTIRRAFNYDRFTLLFATMANPHPTILSWIADEGSGACVNSISHLYSAIDAGIEPTCIQFSSTGLPIRDLIVIRDLGIQFNADSVTQARRWFELAHGSVAGIRLNAASLSGRDGGDRIGCEVESIPEFVRVAHEHGGRISGVHSYIGTNFLSVDEMLPTLRELFKAAETIPGVSYVNIGGGMGIDYTHTANSFDINRFGTEVCDLVRILSNRTGTQPFLYFEPGRGIMAPVGRFLTRVTDVKVLNGVRYIGVDGSVAVFPRPLHHPESEHRVRLLGAEQNDMAPAVVVGCTTFSRDILARQQLPTWIQENDLLVFDDAGAYCDSMGSKFLGQKKPASIFV